MTEPVSLDRGRIRLGELLVYPEHVRRPSAPLPPGVVPPASGVAPTALGAGGEILIAVAEGEAIWLGFQPTDRTHPAVVRVRVENDPALDAMTGEAWEPNLVEAPRNYLVVPPDSRLVGVPGDGGRDLFTSPMRLSILVVDPPSIARIHLVGPSMFERLTGLVPPPLDPGGAYTGWRAD